MKCQAQIIQEPSCIAFTIQFFSEDIYCLILTKVKPLAESGVEEKRRNIEQRGETIKLFSQRLKKCVEFQSN